MEESSSEGETFGLFSAESFITKTDQHKNKGILKKTIIDIYQNVKL